MVPSVSAERVKLWSYADLMGLRVIYWLRHTKTADDGYDVPPASMPAVRKALSSLRELDLELWTEQSGPQVAVDRGGQVVLNPKELPETVTHQTMADTDVLGLTYPFPTGEGVHGPDLHKPRPHLRIVPGKLAGSPHVERTRMETRALAALARREMTGEKIIRLYPFVSPEALREAIDLERQLAHNLVGETA